MKTLTFKKGKSSSCKEKLSRKKLKCKRRKRRPGFIFKTSRISLTRSSNKTQPHFFQIIPLRKEPNKANPRRWISPKVHKKLKSQLPMTLKYLNRPLTPKLKNKSYWLKGPSVRENFFKNWKSKAIKCINNNKLRIPNATNKICCTSGSTTILSRSNTISSWENWIGPGSSCIRLSWWWRRN